MNIIQSMTIIYFFLLFKRNPEAQKNPTKLGAVFHFKNKHGAVLDQQKTCLYSEFIFRSDRFTYLYDALGFLLKKQKKCT